jgi:hypothetical protein
MADFVAVLKKTIDGLADQTPELRQKVYAKARDTVAAKLAAISPAPSAIVIDRQKKALEDAISAVEASYRQAATGGGDDFDSILADLEAKPRTEAPMAAAPAVPAAAAAILPEPAAPPPSKSMEAAVADAPKVAVVAEKAAPAPFPNAERQAASPAPAVAPEAPKPSPYVPRASRLATPPELEKNGAEEPLVAVETTPRPVPALPRATMPEDAPSTAVERGATPPRRNNKVRTLAAAAVVLVLVGGAGYGVWLNRDAFAGLFGGSGNVVAGDPEPEVADEPTVEEIIAAQEEAGGEDEAPVEEEVEVAAAEPTPPPAPADAARALPEVQKFTQRLNPDGTETDPGPAGGERSVGEGTSLAAATEQGATASDAAPAGAGAAPAALPVGQRAIFYEERTTVADGSADEGATVWTLVQESPGGDQPPEPAIRGEVAIPSRDLSIRMTIRRNADPSLPASHIVEMIFITSGTFEGGGVDNILRIAFKGSEAAPGAPLIGIPAKIADGYFLVALSNNDAERNQNTQLMLQQQWIDIPIAYRSGRRALVTMEKGIPGNKVFQDAIRAWQAASSG